MSCPVEVARASSRNSQLSSQLSSYPIIQLSINPSIEQTPYQGDYSLSRHHRVQNYNSPTTTFLTGFKGSSDTLFKPFKCQPVLKFNPLVCYLVIMHRNLGSSWSTSCCRTSEASCTAWAASMEVFLRSQDATLGERLPSCSVTTLLRTSHPEAQK